MEKIKIDDFTHYNFLSGLQVEKESSKCLLTISKAKENLRGYDKNLYVYDNELKQITFDGNASDAIWVNKDKILLQTQNNAESVKYSLLNINDLSKEEVFTLPFNNASVKLSNNYTILSSKIDVNNPDFYRLNELERKTWNETHKTEKDYQIIDEIPFYYNAKGFVNKKRQSLFVMNGFDTNTLVRITEPLMDVKGWCVAENKIYYLGDVYKTVETRKPCLYKYDLVTKKTSLLYKNDEIQIKTISYIDDKVLMYGSDYKQHGKHQNLTLYSFDCSTYEFAVYYDNHESIVNSVCSDCRYGSARNTQAADNGMYFISTRMHDSYLYFVNNEEKKVFDSKGTIEDFCVGNNRIYFVGMQNMELQELYYYDKISNKVIKCTSLNEKLLENRYVAELNPLNSKTKEWDIYGFVLKPINFKSEKKYPAILNIHGGPNTVYGNVFFHEMQYWASEGYFVIFCNPFGSDGRGDLFMDLRGKYGTIDYDAIMDFVDEALYQYPSIDLKRVCVAGGSYGGYLTNWIIGHTNRFVAAASQRSMSNFTSLAGVSDLGYRFVIDQCNVDNVPDNIDKLWWHSPIKYAHKVTTPTLFIHSDEDYRCPLEQAIQMVNALLMNGVETRMCIFHGENHELSRNGIPEHRIRRLFEITTWFNNHTK